MTQPQTELPEIVTPLYTRAQLQQYAEQYAAAVTGTAKIEEPKWYQSKKLFALLAGIIAVILVMAVGVVWALDKTIILGAFSSISGLVTVLIGGQSTVDVKQATSPYFPSGGAYAPNVSVPSPTPVTPEATSTPSTSPVRDI